MKYASILLFIFLISCASDKVYVVKTEKIYRYPKQVNEIEKPELQELDKTESFNSDNNTERRLKNLMELISYIKKLELKIKKYEDDINEIKREEDESNKKDK